MQAKLNYFSLEARYTEKLILGHTLTYLLNSVNILRVITILCEDLNHAIHELPLHFCRLACLQFSRHGHLAPQAYCLVLMDVDMRLYLIKSENFL